MASNALERAVVEAARAWGLLGALHPDKPAAEDALDRAVEKLELHLAAQDPTVKERGWHEVTEGDHLKSIKNGNFYEVTRVLKRARGKYEIVVDVAGKPQVLTRPTPTEPTAWIKRGAAGAAVDIITHVFASGPNPSE